MVGDQCAGLDGPLCGATGEVVMGTSPKPLRIEVRGLPSTNPVLQRLVEQGHELTFVGDTDVDVIIGRKCWRTLPDLKYLEVTLKQVRGERYP